jgi:hypothetical protein
MLSRKQAGDTSPAWLLLHCSRPTTAHGGACWPPTIQLHDVEHLENNGGLTVELFPDGTLRRHVAMPLLLGKLVGLHVPPLFEFRWQISHVTYFIIVGEYSYSNLGINHQSGNL